MIVVRKVVRSLMAVMPRWLLVIFGVCLAIPLARLVVLVLTAALCLMQPARVRRAASAWKGGKSHRRRDESLAGIRSAAQLRGIVEEPFARSTGRLSAN